VIELPLGEPAGRLLTQIRHAQGLFKEIEAFYKRLLERESGPVPGWALVPGDVRRSIADPVGALERLIEMFSVSCYDSIKDFAKVFQQGEAIWNHNFLIVPPVNFNRLDYTSSAFPGYVMRPNILCLFRMLSGGANAKTFNVVRINPSVFEDPKFEVPNYRTTKTKAASSGFRSHAELLTDDDLQRPVLGHELGHAINEEHILAMKGDAQCKIDPNLGRCYGLTPEEVRNIMGSGREIAEITGCDPINCVTVLLTDSKVRPLPPNKIPVAKPKPAFGLKR
jgi:hypothetical protein